VPSSRHLPQNLPNPGPLAPLAKNINHLQAAQGEGHNLDLRILVTSTVAFRIDGDHVVTPRFGASLALLSSNLFGDPLPLGNVFAHKLPKKEHAIRPSLSTGSTLFACTDPIGHGVAGRLGWEIGCPV